MASRILSDEEYKENIRNGVYESINMNVFCLTAYEGSIWATPRTPQNSEGPCGWARSRIPLAPKVRDNSEAQSVWPRDPLALVVPKVPENSDAQGGWPRQPVPLAPTAFWRPSVSSTPRLQLSNEGVPANLKSLERGTALAAPDLKKKAFYSENASNSGIGDPKSSLGNLSETKNFIFKGNPSKNRRQSFDSGVPGSKFSNGQNRNCFAHGTGATSGDLSESNMYFQPIASNSNPSPTPSTVSSAADLTPVDLIVSNLDQTSFPEMKKVLSSIFAECTSILRMTYHFQSDGHLMAVVRVPSHTDAQYVISQLQGKRVGPKKILISYSQSSSSEHYKSHIKTLLSEVPYCKLPLSKFVELLDIRYSINITVCELSKMKDVCNITVENGLRMVSLVINPMERPSISPIEPTLVQDIQPFCTRHFNIPNDPSIGWAEQKTIPLPNVIISLSEFSKNVQDLLASHDYSLPLASFRICYVKTYGEFVESDEGVPLEHLVTCVKDVQLKTVNGMKFLQPASSCETADTTSNEFTCKSPSLATSVSQFKSELVKFLKTLPRSQILFNKFIPGYHSHFGRQCRVADYGFTRLIDLLEAMPNTVQVYGEGSQRMITLSHQAQVRRFTSDLLRVLKVQPLRKLPLGELPEQFERVLERPFNVVDYGLCSLSDLLSCVSSNTVVVVDEDGCEVVTVFSREQTDEERRRTKVFSKEVVELFRHAVNSSVILFDKFVPIYHHHFGYQCRVSDYGFTRLLDLFEIIPDTVKIGHNETGQRTVILTIEKKLEVLGEQIQDIVMPSGLDLSYLPSAFLWQLGYSLKPQEYDEPDLESLIKKLPHVILKSNVVEPTEEGLLKHITVQVRKLLINSEEGVATPSVLAACLSSYPRRHWTLTSLVKLMPGIVEISRDDSGSQQLQLTPLYFTVRRIVSLLNISKGNLHLTRLEIAYWKEYGTGTRPQSFGFSCTTELVKAIPRDVWTLYGKGRKRLICLSEGMTYREKRSQPKGGRHSSEMTRSRLPMQDVESGRFYAQNDVKNESNGHDSSLPKPRQLFTEEWPPLTSGLHMSSVEFKSPFDKNKN